jgi:hypothetical protein
MLRCPDGRLHGQRLGEALEAWRDYLQVHQPVRTERVSRFQVTGEDGRPGAELVGVVHDEVQATIYHTRALTAEDLVHELLHVARPHWTEEMVVQETARLLDVARVARVERDGEVYAAA